MGRIRRPGPQPISSAASRARQRASVSTSRPRTTSAAGGEELLLVLLAAPEGHVVIGVLAGAPVPVGAHALEHLGIVHLAVVILTFMALAFRRVYVRRRFAISTPPRRMAAVIGIVGENGSGKSLLLRLAAGIEQPLLRHGRDSREPLACWARTTRWILRRRAGPAHRSHLRAATTALVRERAARGARPPAPRAAPRCWWSRTKRSCCAAWRTRSGGSTEGPPGRARRPRRDAGGLPQAHRRAAARLGRNGSPPPLAPRMRRGDGRAEVLRIETIGEDGRPTIVWRSGELAVVKVTGALPRGGGRSRGGHHDPHAHRAQRLRHQHRAGDA